MGIIWNNNKPEVQGNIAEGGWDVNYGNEVDGWEIAIVVIGSALGGVSLPVWAEWQLTAQLKKFGQALDDISSGILQQVIKILEEILKGKTGEWDIGGLGIKGGVATYSHWWKIPPFGGWNVGLPSFQPYIAFRLAGPLRTENLASKIVKPPVSIAKTFPTPSPSSEPPPGSAPEDIYWAYGKRDSIQDLATK